MALGQRDPELERLWREPQSPQNQRFSTRQLSFKAHVFEN